MGETADQELVEVDPLLEAVISLAVAAGPAVVGIVVVLGVLFVGTKYLGVGFTVGPKAKLVDDGKLTKVGDGIEKIGDKIDALDRRVSAVEHNVESRATREELHDIRLAMARYEGELQVAKQIATQTNATVLRIEGYMYDYSVARQTIGHWPGRRPKEGE